MSDAPNVVVGKRRPFWEGYDDWTTAVLEIASPLVFVGTGLWLVRLVRAGHLFDDEHFGHTVVAGGIVALVCALSIVGMWMLASSVRAVVLASACPCCGAQRTRNYGVPSDPAPAPCGTCLAYLRASGVEVSEERPEAVKTIGLPYELASEHYLPAVRRDNRNHFKFEWPAMCAVCGAVATKRREIGEWGKLEVDLGIVGTVAHIAAVEAGVTPARYDESIHHAAPLTSRTPDEQLDRELSHLVVPVCAKHTEDEDRFADPLEFRSGKLLFASYGYYREFCRLNQIGTTLKSVTSATGSPTASSPQ